MQYNGTSPILINILLTTLSSIDGIYSTTVSDTEIDVVSTHPLPPPTILIPSGAVSLRGTYTQDAGNCMIEGRWAMSNDILDDPQGETNPFEYTMRIVGADTSHSPDVPQSGSYTGSFLLNTMDGVEKIKDDVQLEFVRNSEGFYNVEGSGVNPCGHYRISGIFKDGQLTINRVYDSSEFELAFRNEHTVLNVGARVMVRWGDNESYEGTVLAYDPLTSLHLIKYDLDGKEYKEDLAGAGYHLLDEDELCDVKDEDDNEDDFCVMEEEEDDDEEFIRPQKRCKKESASGRPVKANSREKRNKSTSSGRKNVGTTSSRKRSSSSRDETAQFVIDTSSPRAIVIESYTDMTYDVMLRYDDSRGGEFIEIVDGVRYRGDAVLRRLPFDHLQFGSDATEERSSSIPSWDYSGYEVTVSSIPEDEVLPTSSTTNEIYVPDTKRRKVSTGEDSSLPPGTYKVTVKVDDQVVREEHPATMPDGRAITVTVKLQDRLIANVPSSHTSTTRRTSALSPTVELLPEVTTGLGTEEITSDEFKPLLGLGNGAQRGMAAVEQYQGENKMLNLIQKHYERRLANHNQMVVSGFTIPPNRQDILEYYEEMGDLINDTDFVANMGEVATAVSRAYAMMHYATTEDIDYEHPIFGLLCKMDRSGLCPGFVGKCLANTAMYHTTGVYTKAVDRSEIVMSDCICVCLEKGPKKELVKQCNTFLDQMGVREYFVERGISTYDAMFTIMVPIYAFNSDQILFNNKGEKPTPVLAVGGHAAELMENENIYSTAQSHGCGSMPHPDYLTDGKKQGVSEQELVNADARITTWLRAVLHKDLEQIGLSVDQLQCYITWTLKYGRLTAEEIKLLEESLMSRILQLASEAVMKEKRDFPGMSNGDIAEELLRDPVKLQDYGLNPRSMKSYVFLCRSMEKLALHQVSKAVKKEKRNSPGMSNGDVAEALARDADKLEEHSLTEAMVQTYVDFCRSREKRDVDQVSKVVKKEKRNYPKMSKAEVAEELARDADKLEQHSLTEEMVQTYVDFCRTAEKRDVEQVSKVVKKEKHNYPEMSKAEVAEELARDDDKLSEHGLTREMIQTYVDGCKARTRGQRPSDGEAELEIKAALAGLSNLDDKIALLRKVDKISSLRKQLDSIRIGGSSKNKSLSYSTPEHWRKQGRGAPKEQKFIFEPNNADIKKSIRVILNTLLSVMESDDIFGEMNWEDMKKQLARILDPK